ncbi:hypothetical protein NLJ89_g323 [Agrocybe chaxingu]|uniref:Uncharacterized protein n=1 Tax=Agrocybe chaxingu TaxID=84603 RepID=A0A9W8N2D4_9AGAR|nr:hypothetical protein NLJ89_g323 [Agrocybe chaxingu]
MNHTQGAIVAVQFRQACAEFTFRDRRRIRSLTVVLELTAQSLVQSESIRAQAGADLKLWPDLRKLWRDLARTQLSFWDTYDSGDEDEDHDENEQDRGLCELCMNLAKFTRNLVAGVPANQLRAYENEPDIRRLLHFYTSWSAMEDPKAMATARALTQALSNMVTTNDTLVATLWESYLNLAEDQVVLIRLLGSPDAKTLLTTLVFILNCIHGSRKRAQLLVKTRVGVRISIGLLDNMVRLHEAEEGSDAAKAFDVGYTIFTQFVEAGMIPDLYKKFALKGEIVTPHQTTLLKLVDSYLQSTQLGTASIQIPDILQTHESLGPFLAKRFFSLSEYAQAAIHRALGMDPTPRTTNRSDESATTSGSSDSISSSGPLSAASSSASTTPDSPPPPKELDVMLPKVCEALVLLTQCIITICLEAEEQQMRLEEGISTFVSFANMKSYFVQKKYQDQGVVEVLIGPYGNPLSPLLFVLSDEAVSLSVSVCLSSL